MTINEKSLEEIDDTFEKVQTIVADQLCLEKTQVRLDAHFARELGADSLDVVELVMALEEGFNIEIADDAASQILTVKNAVDFINLQLGKTK